MHSTGLFISSKFSYFFVSKASDISFEIIIHFLGDPFQATSQNRRKKTCII